MLSITVIKLLWNVVTRTACIMKVEPWIFVCWFYALKWYFQSWKFTFLLVRVRRVSRTGLCVWAGVLLCASVCMHVFLLFVMPTWFVMCLLFAPWTSSALPGGLKCEFCNLSAMQTSQRASLLKERSFNLFFSTNALEQFFFYFIPDHSWK